MASYETILDCDNNSVNKIIKIQSCVRRWLVKKLVMEIKQSYKDLVLGLDGPEVEVIWHRDTPTYPSVRKTNTSSTSLSRAKDSSSSATSHSSKNSPSLFILTSEQQTARTDLPFSNQDNFLNKVSLVSTLVQTEMIPSDLVVYETNASHEAEKSEISMKSKRSNRSLSDAGCNSSIDKSAEPDVHKLLKETEINSHSSIPEQCSSESSVPFKPDNDEATGTLNTVYKFDSPSENANVMDKSIQYFDQTVQSKNIGETMISDLPDDKDQLLQLKRTMAMELLWVQQAINSRKNYLQLKQGMQ
ncbi:IQ domain-containing protein C [Biomphalaria glabrata]|uniref:Uncharacterized protein LOC106074713 n=1 Tax=Biomphalaria glabrata TaxID=6526 RepID=A0A9U8EK34_BIOGL|nr:uncharacterized protein LOC106074713 [Biomphalaria glabrata]KAI8736841.1 hypothetical protein BgiMline_025995 [Biomphalaria glabrata]